MAIALACPSCAGSVPVSSDMGGKLAVCPRCRMQLILPRSLIESPDRDDTATLDEVEPPPSPRRVLMLWVLGIGGVVVLLALICGGPIGIVYMLMRGEREAAALAEQVKVLPPGVDLPAGAPPRAQRVKDFNGVCRIDGQLVQGDERFKRAGGGLGGMNHVCKEYVIDLEAGKTYIINLDEPPGLDAFLRLAHINGQIIAENDDANGSLNSEIRFVAPETKSYLVVATTLSGGLGAYTLFVRESHFKKPR